MSLRKRRPYYYLRLLRWHLLQDRSPIAASLKITQRCNLRCQHCAWRREDGRERTLDDWKNTVDELYGRGVSLIAVEGGEPTLCEWAPELVAHIRGKGMYCIFITNGTREIAHISPDVFWISIDGLEASHDSLRGKGSFRKTLLTIEANQGRSMMALTTLSRRNMHEAEQLCSTLSPLMSGLIFNFTYPYRGTEELSLNRDERAALAGELMGLKKRYPRLLNSNSYLRSVGRRKAVQPWLLATVASDGKSIQGCMVRHLEAQNCNECDMGCCAELSHSYALRLDSLQFWSRSFGLPKLF